MQRRAYHSYEGAKIDFKTYGPLFHDIVENNLRFQVHRFWTEVKEKYRHIELVNELNEKRGGIGVLYVD